MVNDFIKLMSIVRLYVTTCLCLTLIPGITLGFMPATGWTNTELISSRCYYVALFPGTLLLINSFLSVVPIIVVVILYFCILVRALKTVKDLNTGVKNVGANAESRNNSKLRISRGTIHEKPIIQSNNIPENILNSKLTRSASFNINHRIEEGIIVNPTTLVSTKSESNHDLNVSQTSMANNLGTIDSQNKSLDGSSSMLSICTVESQVSDPNLSMTNVNTSKFQKQVTKICNVNAITRKAKEPNKWRAITIVMLTSGSFLFTWMPFFIAVTVFAFCEDKLANPKCMHIRMLLGGPLAALAFLNSILNPLIYAWWHKGFQQSVRSYYRKYRLRRICWIDR